MPMPSVRFTSAVTLAALLSCPALGQNQQAMDDIPSAADAPGHQESAHHHLGAPSPDLEAPALPDGMTLDEVLSYADSEPPSHFPDPVADDQLFGFLRFNQFEYRVTDDDAPDHLGWEADAWFGGDINLFWWKGEGEAIFDGPNEGESENDFLYSLLFTPFWSVQTGIQYANGWTDDDYEDRWSYVLALQGVAPYQVELDSSLYVSEDGDLTMEAEGEYNLRITQRLVLQPRVAMGLSAQDIPERSLGSGVTHADLDMRLRYAIKREFAPYIGIRYQMLIGETEDISAAEGEKTEQWLFMAGLRFAF